MANNKLNIHGANLEDLQKTADRCSKPEDLAASQPESPAEAADQYAESEYLESSGQQETADQHSRPEAPAASNQPEDPLAALRRALKAREDAKPEAPIPSLETQAAETRLALGIGRTAFRAVDMLENPTGKPPADSLGEPESNSERSDSSEPADESIERADGDSSVADTESESVAPENQEEPGSSDEQDPNESLEVSDKQSPSGSEALKRLAEADTTQLTIRNMAGVAKDLVRVLKTANTLRAPVLFGRIQESTSGILSMLNRFNGAVEEVGGDLPRGETPRLGDAIDQVRYALAVMNNVAEQGFSRRISDEEYSQHAMRLKYSIEELQRFMNVSVGRQKNEKQNQ